MAVELIHIGGGILAATGALLGVAIGTGRINVGDLKAVLSFDFSPGNSPQELADEAKENIGQLEADNDNELKRLIGRELDHMITTAYHEGKREGQMNADNEDKHFKVSVVAMLSTLGVLGLLLLQQFGMV